MNNFEIMRLLDQMISRVRFISIETSVYYINEVLSIDKNSH